MSPVLRRTLIAVAILAGIVSVLGWRFLAAAGYFTSIKQEVAAQCTAIPSPPGPEDIQIDRARGLAFVAASDRRAIMAGETAARGGIYAIDLTAPSDQWSLHPVTATEPADFHPHGIGLYSAEGVRRLFAVNHRASGKQTIEIFDIAADGMLTHFKTVEDPLFISPNDVVAVGPEAFYITNDHGTANKTMAMIDDLLLLRKSNIVYYDGKSARVAGDRLAFANGINVSADGKSLYATEFFGLALHIYTRDPATGALSPRDYTPLGTGLDNIDVEEDGALLIAAHPKITSFIGHAGDPKKLSPSQVIRVELSPSGDGGRAGTIYLNLGEQLSGSSVAAGYRDMMLIGNVFDPKILACKQSKEIRAF
ncbi:MAG: SMP-30/gluconolactonase/LRE family protein [Parvibaculum sp.]|uniref:strictosidine synthase family protein n=1 Tax=Parvibaculum sp. TaxID=2024848 RepID=UPI0025CB9CF4|nr:SMP-30/gluconolactonase/LRE family protein [Parvibaculum sp.]MCE9648790.1 SMP-30/gluconolactonase/LRE family protein [Parvibaculum sp.]